MDFIMLLGTDIFNYVVMPILILISRVLDVSFGTIRVIFVSQGYKRLATILAFFEILIWILVARQVITNLDNFTWIIGYCAGYALGTYLGITICERLKIGKVSVSVIVKYNSDKLIQKLKKKGFGVTYFNASGIKSESRMIMSIINLKDLDEYMTIVRKNNPKAFFSIETIKQVREGTFKKHAKKFKVRKNLGFHSFPIRKGK